MEKYEKSYLYSVTHGEKLSKWNGDFLLQFLLCMDYERSLLIDGIIRKNGGARMPWGTIIYQICYFVILIFLVQGIFFLVKKVFTHTKGPSEIEKKLDRIIELLEEQKKE